MKNSLPIPMFIFLILSGCGGGTGAPTTGGDGDTDATSLATTRYVNSFTGQDSIEAGSIDKPYKTITYATSVAKGKVINVASGTYNESTGETFPIIVSENTKIVGAKYDVGNKVYPEVIGCNQFSTYQKISFIVYGGSQIKWLRASCPDGTAIHLSGFYNKAIIDSVLIEESKFGVTASGLTGIYRSIIRNIKSSGIEFSSGAESDLIANTISNNGVGITVTDTAKVSFTLDGSNSINIIRNNSACDLRHTGIQPLDASGTIWDDDPYEFTSTTICKDGSNISAESIGTVAHQPKVTSDSPFFNTPRSIQLINPIANKLTDVIDPTLQWAPGGSKLSAAAIFIKPPTLESGKISNLKNSVWYWHSGLPSGSSGSVRYADGVSLINGNLAGSEKAKNLINGGTYYWIAWEWSEITGEIIAASPVGVFRVRP